MTRFPARRTMPIFAVEVRDAVGAEWVIAAGAAGVAVALRRAFPPSFSFADKAVLVRG